MTDSASQSLVDRRWTPEQFWEYLDAFVGDWETKTIRTMMADHGLSLVPAARISKLEAERDRLAGELDASNNNHRVMAHQMAELGARCKHAESELSRVEGETIERCAQCIQDGVGMADIIDQELLDEQARILRSLPPLAKRGDQERPR